MFCTKTFSNVEEEEVPKSPAEAAHQMVYGAPELNIRDTITIDVFLRIIGQVLEEYDMTHGKSNIGNL